MTEVFQVNGLWVEYTWDEYGIVRFTWKGEEVRKYQPTRDMARDYIAWKVYEFDSSVSMMCKLTLCENCHVVCSHPCHKTMGGAGHGEDVAA